MEEDLDRAVAACDWASVEELCEMHELQVAPNPSVLVAEHMLCLLVMDKPQHAGFVFERAGGDVKGDNGSQAGPYSFLWLITCAVQQMEFGQAFELINEAQNAPGTMQTRMGSMLAALRMRLQDRVFSVVSRSHCSIRLEELAGLLGMSPEETAHECAARPGWRLDETQSFVEVPPASDSRSLLSTRVKDLERISETMFRLYS